MLSLIHCIALVVALATDETPEEKTRKLADWTLAAMLAHAPPERQDGNPWADPSPEAARTRYEGIRDAIVAQCPDRHCASLLVALAIGESGLARDADLGPCHREGKWKTRCDSGRAASVWQVQAFGNDEQGQKITVARLFAERELAAWAMRRAASSSLKACKHLPPEQRLANLGGGHCQPNKSATARYHLWQKIKGWNPAKK